MLFRSAPYSDVIDDTLRLIALGAEAAGATTLRFRDRHADANKEAERISVADAFQKYANVNLLGALEKDGAPNVRALAEQATAQNIKLAHDDTWSDIFSRVLTERVEPNLGIGRITVLDEYPRTEAALARASSHDPRVAERFEIYACGVELANGFGELTDAREDRKSTRLNSSHSQQSRMPSSA